MTRLLEEDVEGICWGLDDYDSRLIEKTQLSLRQIACRAAGISEKVLSQKAANNSVAVIPITVGEGLIPSFTSAVQGISEHLGFQTFVTTKTDVAGIAQGVFGGAKILLMADDHQFIALNLLTGAMADNGEATGRGFVAALEGLARGIRGKEVLVLGAGPVGRAAISQLNSLGATTAVFEIDETKIEELKKDSQIKVEQDFRKALSKYSYIVDATPKGGFIQLVDLHPDTKIACPGMPLGLASITDPTSTENLVHDPLQIGVATMLTMALR